MKTLFIQTHELAQHLLKTVLKDKQPSFLELWKQAETFVANKAGIYEFNHWNGYFHDADAVVHSIMALLKEQKEDRVWHKDTSFKDGVGYLVQGCFPVPFGTARAKGIAQAREDLIHGIIQRLINSLLTRPDRTLCVLIPE